MVILNYIINYTKTGRAMRAVSYDLGAASLMGVNVNRTIAITFVIGSVLAGAGGVLYATAYPQVDPFMGYIPGLKAFVAAVLGGIGSIPGAMIHKNRRNCNADKSDNKKNYCISNKFVFHSAAPKLLQLLFCQANLPA